jgi:hypothetical protein
MRPKLLFVVCLAAGAVCAGAESRAGVRARHAMVVTGEQHATEAAVSILKSGGNAGSWTIPKPGRNALNAG